MNNWPILQVSSPRIPINFPKHLAFFFGLCRQYAAADPEDLDVHQRLELFLADWNGFVFGLSNWSVFFGFFVQQNTEWLNSTGVFFVGGERIGGLEVEICDIWHIMTWYVFSSELNFQSRFSSFFLHIFVLGMRGHNLGAVFFRNGCENS